MVSAIVSRPRKFRRRLLMEICRNIQADPLKHSQLTLGPLDADVDMEVCRNIQADPLKPLPLDLGNSDAEVDMEVRGNIRADSFKPSPLCLCNRDTGFHLTNAEH